jgi:hypothetical protein
MKSSLFVAFLALGLASCGLVAEYRAQQQAQINAADDAQCQSYGVAWRCMAPAARQAYR